MRTISKSLIVVGVLTTVLGLAGCDDNGSLNILAFKVSVSTQTDSGTIVAILRNGTPPAENGGPSLTAPPTGSAVNGGAMQVQLTANRDAKTVFISVAGVSGYFELQLPTPLSVIDLLIVLQQVLPSSTFDCVFSLADEAGLVGPSATTEVTVTEVGTGDLQVSLNINVSNDIDLHVVDPNGFEIYWDQLVSPEGGTLDLDTNASCDIDGVNNENISWPTGQAPEGEYTVRVDNWENCGESAVDWVVSINKGGAVTTHTGSFTADDPGDMGDEGSGVTVTTFTFP